MTSGAGPARQHELLLAIGGIVGHLQLRGAQPLFVEQLRARYGTFLLPMSARARTDFALRLDLYSAAPPGSLTRGRRPAEYPLQVSALSHEIAIDRWDVRVRLKRTGKGRRLDYRGKGECAMSPFAVDCILRVIWATLLPHVGGLLVHGCGLRHAEVAVVFPGQSGAGKTTLARKAPDSDDVLSDELCVVRRADDGWRVHGTPFWGDFARGGISMRSWPLRTVAMLTQARSDTVAMTPIVSSDATFRLLGCFLAFAIDRTTVERNLALALKLCAEVRSVEASLTKNVLPSEIFRKLAPHLGPEVTRKVPPASAREMISDLRSHLSRERSYTFKPKAAATRPWLRAGDSLRVELAGARDVGTGDIVLCWRPGATPDDDTLVCRRVDTDVRAAFAQDGTEVLGKVAVVARDGKPWPMPRHIGDLQRMFGVIVAEPIVRTVKS